MQVLATELRNQNRTLRQLKRTSRSEVCDINPVLKFNVEDLGWIFDELLKVWAVMHEVFWASQILAAKQPGDE